MPVQPIVAQFGIGKKGGTKVAKKAAGTQALRKSAGVKAAGGTQKLGGVGYKRYSDSLWLPAIQRPDWLDGSLPGDRGFDPLSLGKPAEYLQVEVDQTDFTAFKNEYGDVVGNFDVDNEQLTATPLKPYGDAFSITRFRECELIHGRWAMLACLGILVAESTTGVAWQDAGKVELDGSSYLGFALPFTLTQLIWIEVLAVGGAEIYRNNNLDSQTRQYPGGVFDPLKLASGNDERAFKLKEAEIKHCRLAMTAFFGFTIQACYGNGGALGSLAKFANQLAGQ